jgi:hypothetical protein
MREHLALVDERGGGVLGDHQARRQPGVRGQERRQAGVARRQQGVDAALGEARELGQREREVVERQRQRLAVEVAAGEDLPVGGEHERVVCHRVELALERAAGVVERVADGAEHLRRAAQRVGILDAAAVGMRGDDRRAR